MMQRVYIFEGPDGGGKTTAAKALAMLVNGEYVHIGPPTAGVGGMDVIYARQFSNACARAGDRPVVFDRFHLGERIYGRLYRGNDRLGEVGQFVLEDAIAMHRRVALILCLPPRHVAEANWRGRLAAEMLKDVATWTRVYASYTHAPTRLPVMVYDYTTMVTQDILTRFPA